MSIAKMAQVVGSDERRPCRSPSQCSSEMGGDFKQLEASPCQPECGFNSPSQLATSGLASRRALMTSITAGKMERTIIARITSLKFFSTIGVDPKKKPR